MNEPDWIVVGAGSAGCMVACQLSQAAVPGRTRVTVIEPAGEPAPLINRERPARWLHLLGSSEDWNLTTEKSHRLANRSLRWPRGRGLGGSSRINAMIWFPPTQEDYEMLVAASGGQWTLAELQENFREVTELTRPEHPAWLSESSHRFLKATAQWSDASPMAYARLNRDGRRWNPADLLTAGRQNGSIQMRRAMVDRMIWKDDRIIGVETLDKHGVNSIHARKGVILCAGSIATPAILMRSGIGPRNQLNKLGINLRYDTDRVGNNLRDHLIMPVIFQVKSGRFPTRYSTRNIAQWQTMGSGPLASNLAECGGLFQNNTIQIHVTPTHYLTHPRQAEHAFMTIGVSSTQPQSTGQIQLTASDARAPLRIDARYLQEPDDLKTTIKGVELARRLVKDTSLSQWIVSESIPGKRRGTARDMEKAIARYSQTLYHPACTCPLGSESDSIITPNFSIRGAEQGWVADASILPRLTHGNPNATVMLLAYSAAKRIINASL